MNLTRALIVPVDLSTPEILVDMMFSVCAWRIKPNRTVESTSGNKRRYCMIRPGPKLGEWWWPAIAEMGRWKAWSSFSHNTA
jgi:hypothetical protein